MSDHAEKVLAGLDYPWQRGKTKDEAVVALRALVGERDELRARVEQLEAELDNFKAALQLANKNTERRGRKCEQLEAVLRDFLEITDDVDPTMRRIRSQAEDALSGLGDAG